MAALRTEPEALTRDLNFMGLLFESMVIRDLRIYAQPIDGEVMHYQDNQAIQPSSRSSSGPATDTSARMESTSSDRLPRSVTMGPSRGG